MKVLIRGLYLLLLVCAACNLSQQAASTTLPAPLATPTAEVALITYGNTAYNYAIQYPEGVAVEGNADSQFVWIDRQIYMIVSDLNPEKPMGDAPVIESAQDTMIGTFTARRLSGYIGAVGGGTPQRYESFVIAHNNLYYQFIAYELKRGDVQPVDRTMNPVPPEVVALLTQIVTSLRFTT